MAVQGLVLLLLLCCCLLHLHITQVKVSARPAGATAECGRDADRDALMASHQDCLHDQVPVPAAATAHPYKYRAEHVIRLLPLNGRSCSRKPCDSTPASTHPEETARRGRPLGRCHSRFSCTGRRPLLASAGGMPPAEPACVGRYSTSGSAAAHLYKPVFDLALLLTAALSLPTGGCCLLPCLLEQALLVLQAAFKRGLLSLQILSLHNACCCMVEPLSWCQSMMWP